MYVCMYVGKYVMYCFARSLITIIINQAILTSTFPDTWKLARIIPVFKKLINSH
jgi:hypothetical protein